MAVFTDVKLDTKSQNYLTTLQYNVNIMLSKKLIEH